MAAAAAVRPLRRGAVRPPRSTPDRRDRQRAARRRAGGHRHDDRDRDGVDRRCPHCPVPARDGRGVRRQFVAHPAADARATQRPRACQRAIFDSYVCAEIFQKLNHIKRNVNIREIIPMRIT